MWLIYKYGIKVVGEARTISESDVAQADPQTPKPLRAVRYRDDKKIVNPSRITDQAVLSIRLMLPPCLHRSLYWVARCTSFRSP